MGTQKGFNAKKVSSPTTVKNISTSNAKKANPVSRRSKPMRRPDVTQGWEGKENQLILALREEGKTDKQMSQQLRGRSR